MSVIGLNGSEFSDLARQFLRDGTKVRFQARGGSMHPYIRDGDILVVAPFDLKDIDIGDVLLVDAGEGRLLAHRLVGINRNNRKIRCLIKSDASDKSDGWFIHEDILGCISVVERGAQRFDLLTRGHRLKARLWVTFAPWASRLSWLPGELRNLVRHWLLSG